ncbi:hypothetical protein RDWZM_004892 [Blomia tropicalis]|uniref:Mediator of RNA polymerase II transcription subunit 9 n=1 Tax=Blomia tropicalis TaxID=40697 RepID=A0A9Q0M835_BLOTA|nr:hypothetical protein BLOT_014313 [Blomia tropicalis]KAJ6219080.1 hypothetical protein RDWZM_004892 [Blomia tropicalis]
MSVTVQDLNTDFLPLIYDIIRSLEKETHENPSQKVILITQQSNSDPHGKVQQLKDLFAEFRSTVPKISGIDSSKEEQLHRLYVLREQLVMKKELLMKYKKNSSFEALRKQQQASMQLELENATE